MSRWQRLTFNWLAAVMTVSGAAYFWMKDVMEAADPFAVVNHPLQPFALHLHVFAAPWFLVVFGIVFNSHIGRKVGRRLPNWRSGMLALATMALMTVSGYALQISVAESTRNLWVALHVGSGAVFALAYVTHLVAGVRLAIVERTNARGSAA